MIQDVQVSKGLTEQELEKLDEVHVDTVRKGEDPKLIRCTICQDNFGHSSQVIELRCDHFYHTDCIKKWLKIKKTCPLCLDHVQIETQNK